MNLVFYDSKTKDALLFDGIEFSRIQNSIFDASEFVELEYSKNNVSGLIYIESVKSDFDICYLKLSNGDIFQTFYPMNDVELPQQLLIFETSHWHYNHILHELDCIPEVEILEETHKDVDEWFYRKG